MRVHQAETAIGRTPPDLGGVVDAVDTVEFPAQVQRAGAQRVLGVATGTCWGSDGSRLRMFGVGIQVGWYRFSVISV